MKKIVLSSFFIFWVSAAWATTYYIDPDATNCVFSSHVATDYDEATQTCGEGELDVYDQLEYVVETFTLGGDDLVQIRSNPAGGTVVINEAGNINFDVDDTGTSGHPLTIECRSGDVCELEFYNMDILASGQNCEGTESWENVTGNVWECATYTYDSANLWFRTAAYSTLVGHWQDDLADVGDYSIDVDNDWLKINTGGSTSAYNPATIFTNIYRTYISPITFAGNNSYIVLDGIHFKNSNSAGRIILTTTAAGSPYGPQYCEIKNCTFENYGEEAMLLYGHYWEIHDNVFLGGWHDDTEGEDLDATSGAQTSLGIILYGGYANVYNNTFSLGRYYMASGIATPTLYNTGEAIKMIHNSKTYTTYHHDIHNNLIENYFNYGVHLVNKFIGISASIETYKPDIDTDIRNNTILNGYMPDPLSTAIDSDPIGIGGGILSGVNASTNANCTNGTTVGLHANCTGFEAPYKCCEDVDLGHCVNTFTNYRIHGNFIKTYYNKGINFADYEGDGASVYNNILVDGPYRTSANTVPINLNCGSDAYNNTIYDIPDLDLDSGFYAFRTSSTDDIYVVNNIVHGFSGAASEIITCSGSAFVFSNNLTSAATDVTGCATECTNCITEEDPGFVDAGNDDFRIASPTSEAVDNGIPIAGLHVYGTWEDYMGTPYIFGAAPDIGAIEYIGTDPLLGIGCFCRRNPALCSPTNPSCYAQ